jgi:hypothetical protein
MEYIKDFFINYASAVSTITALSTLILACITAWYLRREYISKYRPYVMPVVQAEKMDGVLGCVLSIFPKNVGPHPCKVRFIDIQLHIGDETHRTPDIKEWIMLAQTGVDTHIPVGRINSNGVTKIREGRYKTNRVEVSFVLRAMSIEHKFSETKKFSYEIDVLSENPHAMIRPEWVKNV